MYRVNKSFKQIKVQKNYKEQKPIVTNIKIFSGLAGFSPVKKCVYV